MVSADLYKTRREKISQALKAPLIVSAFEAMQQTNDSSAPFVQESNFFWLTGINEPGWKLILANDKSMLVSAFKTEVQRIFDGGMSASEATLISGVDTVINLDEYKAALEAIGKNERTVYTIFKHPHSKYFDFALNPAIAKNQKQLNSIFSDVQDARKELSKLKAIKSEEEIQLIKKAVALSVDAFNDVHANLKNAQHEYEIEAQLSYAFRITGAEGHAYQPIVGTGKNACTLHYIANNDSLVQNGTVLIDAGAKVGNYAADITRTYALGQPSEREIAVHAEVEKAHKAIIDLIKPGESFETYQTSVDTIMKAALENLGLLKTEKDYRKYFPHAISHGLGIDVHDSLGGYDTFQPGMVLTVEPGIYIPEEGIGVRIEDDILVTINGNENLSAALPTSL